MTRKSNEKKRKCTWFWAILDEYGLINDHEINYLNPGMGTMITKNQKIKIEV